MSNNYPICEQNTQLCERIFRFSDKHASSMRGFESSYHQISAGLYLAVTKTVFLCPEISVQSESFNQRLDQWGAIKQNKYSIMLLTEGSARCYLGNQEVGQNDMIIAGPGSDFDMVSSAYSSYCAVMFSKSYIEQHMISHNPKIGDLDCKKIPTIVERQPEIVEILRCIFRHALSVNKEYDLCSNPILLRSLCTTLTHISATIFSDQLLNNSSISNRATKTKQLAHSTRNLLRSQNYMSLSINELAKIMGASRRTLEKAFQVEFGYSPLQYKKIILLNQFRSALMAKDNRSKSIGDIAAEHEIWHLSRLAQQYKNLFGELPSESIIE